MKPLRGALIILAVCLSVAAQDHARLKEIKTIYVDQLGSEEGADLVREKIKLRLLKSKRFTLVEDRDAADAILSGAAGLPRRWNGVPVPVAVLRLIDPRTKETLWIYEHKSAAITIRSTPMPDKVIDKLEKDAKTAAKK